MKTVKPYVEFEWYDMGKKIHTEKKDLRSDVKGLKYNHKRPDRVNLIGFRDDTLTHGAVRYWIYTDVLAALNG